MLDRRMRRRKGTYKKEHQKFPGMEDRSRKQLGKGDRRWRIHPPPPTHRRQFSIQRPHPRGGEMHTLVIRRITGALEQQRDRMMRGLFQDWISSN